MNWKTVAKWPRLVNRRVPSTPVRYRPRLQVLEDRTVLSPVVFNEVQNQSPLTLSGILAGRDIQPQGTGSLTTTYFGTFEADIDMTNGTIKFIGGGNDFCADNTGSWAPLPDGGSGNATAIYGIQVDIRGMSFLGAIRDYHMKADTGGTALALYPNPDGSFGFASTQTISINAGTGTFSFPNILGSGPINLGGLNAPNQAGDGNLVVRSNGSFHITVPVSVSYDTMIGGIRTTLNVNGQIVGDGAYAGPAGHTPIPTTTGAVVISGPDWIGTSSRAVAGTNSDGLTSEIRPSAELATTETVSSAQEVRQRDTTAPVQHTLPEIIDPLTNLPADGF